MTGLSGAGCGEDGTRARGRRPPAVDEAEACGEWHAVHGLRQRSRASRLGPALLGQG